LKRRKANITLEEDSVLASRSPEGQLVEGDDLPSGLQDTLTRLFSHTQSADGHLGDLVNPRKVMYVREVLRIRIQDEALFDSPDPGLRIRIRYHFSGSQIRIISYKIIGT
jgi:hypothetical protein